MADGLDTSYHPTTTFSADVPPAPVTTNATSPGELPAAIAALVEESYAGHGRAETHVTETHAAETHVAEARVAEFPKVESPATQPAAEPAQEIWITAPSTESVPAPAAMAHAAAPVAATIEATTIESTRIEPTRIEPRMPPAAHLVESDIPQAPPPFLREHATRAISATPPLRADPRSGTKPPPGARAPARPPVPVARPAGPPPRQTRFALLAASLAICACVGAGVGSAAIASFSAPAGVAAKPPTASAEVKALRDTVAQLSADLAATRSTIEHINKTNGTQFGKLVERFDRAEKAQGDPSARFAKITDTLERLEKRVAALQVAPAPVAAPAPVNQNDVVGSITPRPAAEPKAPPKPAILETYVLRRVYDGVALIEGRNGVMEVESGQPLPGGIRVEDIRRQDGRWVVVTNKGLIVTR